MNRLILAAALAAGCMLASSAPALAVAKNYDCTKSGNANKAVCKGKPASAAAPAKPAPAAKATASTTKTVSRSYDCTKAGNANKAQCKSSTTVATSVTKPAAKAAPAPAQPGLLQRMKNAMNGSTSAPAPAAKPKAAPRRTAAAAPASVEDHNPAGAIAQCKDGTYSHAKGRTGACSRHGGVAKWS
jgi:hypothetical protein